jgi:hypothetical protein
MQAKAITNTCEYVMRGGHRQGKQCGKSCASGNKYCKNHDNQVFELQALPLDIMGILVENIIDQNHVQNATRRLNILDACCQDMHNVVTEKYKMIYDSLDVDEYIDDILNERKFSYKRRCDLLVNVGCQRCECPFIKQIHWPFPVRVCQDCFEKITIAEYKLNAYNIFPELKSFGRKFTTSKYFGYERHKIFLLKDIKENVPMDQEQIKKINISPNEHMENLVSTIGVSFNELKRFSKEITRNDFPNVKTVAKEYFTYCATKLLETVVEKHGNYDCMYTYMRNSFQKEKDMIQNIACMQEFNDFKKYLQTSDDVIRETLRIADLKTDTNTEIYHFQQYLRKNLPTYHCLPEECTPCGINTEELKKDVKIKKKLLCKWTKEQKRALVDVQ